MVVVVVFVHDDMVMMISIVIVVMLLHDHMVMMVAVMIMMFSHADTSRPNVQVLSDRRGGKS